MNNQYNILLDVVESAIFRDSTITEIELRILIKKLSQEIAPDLLPDELEKIAREIEARQGIKIGFGSIVDNPDFEPWLDKTKPAIDPFYWNRYKKLLRLKRFPRDVIISLDTITIKFLIVLAIQIFLVIGTGEVWWLVMYKVVKQPIIPV